MAAPGATTSASLRAFMHQVLDYAGLFPPAKLPLDQAIRNFARYRKEGETWMLARFVIQASRLGELAAFREGALNDKPAFGFSALGRGGADKAAFVAGLNADLADIAAFRSALGERVFVDAFEVKLPAPVLASADAAQVRGVLDDIAQRVDAEGPPALTPWIEVDFSGNWRASVPAAVSALAHHGRANEKRARYRPAGLKLRCGGLDAAAFPSPENLAFALACARDAGVPVKATAGLHHPIRHFNESVQAKMHGFANLFGAGICAHAKKLPEGRIREIIEDENAGNFKFDALGFTWTDVHVTTGEIVAGRQFVTTFGSCSFDEPREDLRSLGLLA